MAYLRRIKYHSMRLLLSLCSWLIILASCGSADNQNAPGEAMKSFVDSTTMDRHLTELASDKYGGRLPFSEGEVLTLDYLEKELRALGLEPGHGDSYRQEVPMVEITGSPEKTMEVSTPAGTLNWTLGQEYMTFSEVAQPETRVEDSDIVFAGFGIVAPEYGWNDYAGLDVKGKTVVVMVNDPGYYLEDSTVFKGSTMTYYGRYTYKFEEAARQGAAACFVIHETGAAGYPWFVIQSSWSGTRLMLENEGGGRAPRWRLDYPGCRPAVVHGLPSRHYGVV